ncbi:protoporphyrinogen oxidase [Bythopirellula polymerisocia]|uniref:Coproporphyrinogen III oxidase n=1 Tax=Bythopirellula polymerisocia TaxID=2528003 RepID=A0A5C6CC00_9BACT|nr:protoporphyrinogen oxidase [Bythopirellula polymerisocia]TWU21768.1 Protoporphyrinogen oxidase [Bythopirellula polymerisocia]
MPIGPTTQPRNKGRRIAVVGGGISGLAAARRLLDLAPDVQVILLEARDRLGGVLRTEQRDGFLLEHGADNFITTPAWAVEFCQRLGMEEDLLETNSEHRRAFVVCKGKLRAIPAGFAVMAPSRICPIASTPILSMLGKLRMAAELFVPRRIVDESESLAGFVRRRFGYEMYERLVQPLIAGIYTGDPEQLSLGATMPRFRQMEEDHGSLIRAMWKQQKAQRTTAQQSSGARYSQFVAPRRGMSAFVQAIVERLDEAAVLLDSLVARMTPTAQAGWRLTIGGEYSRSLDVDGVILATPAQHSSTLLKSVDSESANAFGKIHYGSCAIVSMGFRREQIGHALDGFGLVVPAIEGRKILSTSFSSIKYAGRAPEGHVLLRAFVGGACQSELLNLDGQQLERMVREELADLLAIRGEPSLCHIVRQNNAMPQYYVGHEGIVRRIEQRAELLPNLALAGNALHGIGVPNCIHTGELAAESLLAKLSQSRHPRDQRQYPFRSASIG